MKKQSYIIIKFIIIFILILIVIDYLITVGLKNNHNGYYGKLNKICNKNRLPQIALFSSSVGEMGFNARLLQAKTKKTVYNFSLTGTTFLQYKGMIDEINKANNNVNLVVMSEVIYTFDKPAGLMEIERFLPYISNQNIYNSLYEIQPDLAFKSRYIPFYKYIATSEQYYLQSLLGWKSLLSSRKTIDTMLGQIEVKRNWEADQDSIWKYAKFIPIIIDTGILNTYKKTVQQLVNNGKKVIISITPIYMPKGQKIVDLTEFRKTLSNLSDNKNVFFWDFSESMVDKKYFYNVTHLNAYGATFFSNFFADSLLNCKQLNM